MIGTVTRQTVSNGTVVTFIEGDLGTASWTPAINQIYDGVVSFLSPDNITSKTVSGFTLTGLLATVEIYGIVSDGGGVDDADPDLQNNAIISVNDVKAYIKESANVSTNDAFIRSLINRVSDDIETSLRSKVKLQSITGFILDGSGCEVLQLPAQCRPIYQIGTGTAAADDIQYRDTPVSTSWSNLVTDIASAYLHAINKHELWVYGYSFPRGHQNIKLNCKAGYYSIPGKIVKVCIEMVAECLYESRRLGGRLGISSTNSNIESAGSNVSYVGLSERHYEELNPYRYMV